MSKRSAGVGNLFASLVAFVFSLAKLGGILAIAAIAGVWRLVAMLIGKPDRKPSTKVANTEVGNPSFNIQVNASLGRQGSKRPKRPPPPSLADYTAAGVDPNLCTLCQKAAPGRPREWKFCAMDGKPFVICPACWNKKYVNADAAEAARFMDRMTTYYSNDKPT